MNLNVIKAVKFTICISFALAQDDIFPVNSLIPDNHKFVKNIKKTPYIAAVLSRGKLIRTGVLIDSQWVLTTADDLHIHGEFLRQLRVRLGSINYNKKGHLVPVRKYEIHPQYQDLEPAYDVALLQLAYMVDDEASILPIQIHQPLPPDNILKMPEKFRVVGYEMMYDEYGPVVNRNDSHRFSLMSSEPLRVNAAICDDYFYQYDINFTSSMLCLEPLRGRINCQRETGGAVVEDNVLWGIVSSWLPFECSTEPSATLVMQLSDSHIGDWIQDIVFLNKHSQIKATKTSTYLNKTETISKSQLSSLNAPSLSQVWNDLDIKNDINTSVNPKKSRRRNKNSSSHIFKPQTSRMESPQMETESSGTRLFQKVTD